MSSDTVAPWTHESSDPELIAGVRAGDTEAFAVLYARHAEAATRVARAYTNTAADAEDVVAESFARVLRALRAGDGPDLAFRAYLFTIVRRTGLDVVAKGKRTRPSDTLEPFEAALGHDAPSDQMALEGFERSLVADAFRSLPERWQAVLWYTEVEKKSPKDIAPVLGLTANGVAALAYRAREALRQAYLQHHLGSTMDEACRDAAPHLGALVRGGLSQRERARVDAHVTTCERCTLLVAELADVNHGMRGIIAPLVLGLAGLPLLEGGLPLGGLGVGGVAGAGAASAGAAPLASGAAGTAGAAGTQAARMAARARAAAPVATVAAAAVVAVVVAALLGVFGSTGSQPVAAGASPVPTADPAPGAGGEGPPSNPSDATPDNTDPDDADLSDSHEVEDEENDADVVVPAGDHGSQGAPAIDPASNPVTPPASLPLANIGMNPIPLGFLAVTRTNPAIPLSVANTGPEASTEVSAVVALPAGLEFAPLTGGGAGLARTGSLLNAMRLALGDPVTVGDWGCTFSAAMTVATCTTSGIDAGGTAEANLAAQVTLEPGEALPADAVTTYTVTWGNTTTTYQVLTGVTAVQENFTSAFTGVGHLTTVHAGAPLLGCETGTSVGAVSCDTVMSFAGVTAASAFNNNSWVMHPLNDAGGVTTSARTTVDIPAGATVVYAALEWSANAGGAATFTGDTGQARFRVPGGDYVDLDADSVTLSTSGDLQYIALADVTAQVAQAGGGEYALADVALATTYQGGSMNFQAGFALTVVYSLDSLPLSQVTVFHGDQWVSTSASPVFSFAAPQDGTATVGIVAWDGDRGTSGDMVRLQDSSSATVNLRSPRWDGTTVGIYDTGGNALASTAIGSDYANTLGTDAFTFLPVEVPRGVGSVTFTSTGDTYLVSTFSVTVAVP